MTIITYYITLAVLLLISPITLFSKKTYLADFIKVTYEYLTALNFTLINKKDLTFLCWLVVLVPNTLLYYH